MPIQWSASKWKIKACTPFRLESDFLLTALWFYRIKPRLLEMAAQHIPSRASIWHPPAQSPTQPGQYGCHCIYPIFFLDSGALFGRNVVQVIGVQWSINWLPVTVCTVLVDKEMLLTIVSSSTCLGTLHQTSAKMTEEYLWPHQKAWPGKKKALTHGVTWSCPGSGTSPTMTNMSAQKIRKPPWKHSKSLSQQSF